MLDVNEINKIVEEVIDLWKKDKGRNILVQPKRDMVNYYDGYLTFADWKRSISIHSVKGTIPIELLSVKAPCQSDQELKYVIDNYKQITLPIPEEFLNTIGRGMHSSNWSIEYQPDEAQFVNSDTSLKEYLEVDIAQSTPLQMSFESWWRGVLPSIKLNDSMGVVAVKPYRQEALTMDENGNEVISGEELPEPIPYYYMTEQVLSHYNEKFVLVDTYERAMVEYAGKMERKGFVFELYDENTIYRIVQTGKYIDNRFDIHIWFEHNLDYIPVKRLMGRPAYLNGSIVWQSPLLLVTDILDEAILDNTNLRSIKASSTYPQKVSIGTICRNAINYDGVYHNCEGGYILNKMGDGYDKCSSCMGSGLEHRTSPLNTILVQPKSSIDSGDQIKPSDALAYVSPSTETPVFLRSEVNDSLMRAKEILHLKTTNSVVTATATDTTATGMVMDEKGKYAFMSLPVDQIFDIGEFVIAAIGGMRYGESFKTPTVQRPISYDFNTDADYLAQISAAQSSGAPPIVVQGYLSKYLKSVYYDDIRVAAIYDLMIVSDRLLSLTQEDINTKLSRQLIAPYEVILHDSARTIINDLILKDPKFLYLDLTTQRDQLIEAAKQLVPVPAVAPLRAFNAASILANANAS